MRGAGSTVSGSIGEFKRTIHVDLIRLDPHTTVLENSISGHIWKIFCVSMKFISLSVSV